MTFADWIKVQIDALRAMLAQDDGPSIPPDGVTEIRSGDQLLLQFRSSTANLSKVRKAIEKFCEHTSLDLAAREEIGLVVNEALANVIRHAYSNVKRSADRTAGRALSHGPADDDPGLGKRCESHWA